MGNNEPLPYIRLETKINTRWIMSIIIKDKNLKFLKEKEKYVYDQKLSKYFSYGKQNPPK